MNKKSKLLACFLSAILITLCSASTIFADTTSSNSNTTIIEGQDVFATSLLISQKGWTTSYTVVLASGMDYADALSAGPLAHKNNAPLILIRGVNLNPDISDELDRLKTKHVIIIGGEGVVSGITEDALKAKGITVNRLGGATRYETSILVADELGNTSEVVIVSGENLPDAICISPIAGMQDLPIILSHSKGLLYGAQCYITDHTIMTIYIVGGTDILSASIDKEAPIIIRLPGPKRYLL